MSKLHSDVLDYFAWENMRCDEREMQLHKLQSLNRRGLYDMANKLNQKMQDDVKTHPIDLWNSLYRLRAWHTLKFSDNPIKTENEPGLWTTLNGLWQKSKNHLNMYYQMDAYNIMNLYSTDLTEQIKALSENSSEQTNDPLSRTLEKLVLFLKHEDQPTYKFLYDALIHQNTAYSPNIGMAILILLMQHNLRIAKRGKGNYKELFKLYEYGMKTGLLLDEGKISDIRFMVAVELASLEEMEVDPEKFLETWAPYLNKDTRDDVVKLAWSTIYIYTERNGKAIDMVSQTSFRRAEDRKTMRILILMASFNLYADDRDFILDQIRNFREYTKRHESDSSPIHQKGLVRFCAIASLIARDKDFKEVMK